GPEHSDAPHIASLPPRTPHSSRHSVASSQLISYSSKYSSVVPAKPALRAARAVRLTLWTERLESQTLGAQVPHAISPPQPSGTTPHSSGSQGRATQASARPGSELSPVH